MIFRQIFFSVIFIVFLSLTFVSARKIKCSEAICSLPSCQCAVSNSNPTAFEVTQIPQLILLTFVGNLNENSLTSIQAIFNSSHRNPNKCPITGTFFVHHPHTDYCLVERLFDNHHEIGSSTASDKCPMMNCDDEYHWQRWTKKDWGREIHQQHAHLVRHAQLDSSHLKGFRAPRLQIDENFHLSYLEKFHFHYDSSMLFDSSTLTWPFTLNYGFSRKNCLNCVSSNQTFNGLWQFPLHALAHSNSETNSNTSCLPTDQPANVDQFYNLLIYNYKRHSSSSIGRRSPWIIELDFAWLSRPRDPRLEALLRFIKLIVNNPKYRHVYFVSIEKALEWMKYPRSLNDLREFWAFRCSDTPQFYSTDCSYQPLHDDSSSITSRIEALKDDGNSSNTTNPQLQILERQAEKLFRSGITLHVLWIFILLLFCVLFYDKYFATK
uniref:Chitin deacetylase 1-like protein n=1 Tax=Philodina roseola TaxID=96448 RepID=B6S327_PHIRO|nr:chitin deacetylase 1-like protein [Philodina roseola]